MSKHILCLLLLLLCFVGCQSGTRGTKLDGTPSSGTFTKCLFDGHAYVVYVDGAFDNRIGGLEHDPDCPKCRK